MTPEPTTTLALLQQLSRSSFRVANATTNIDTKQFLSLSFMREIGPMPQQTLSEILCIDRNNTVLTLNNLEQKGLVTRRRDPNDRRRHLVELTEQGHEFLRVTEQQMQPVAGVMLAALSEPERDQLHELLHRALYGAGGILHEIRLPAAS